MNAFQHFSWMAEFYSINYVQLIVGIYCKTRTFKRKILLPNVEKYTFGKFLLRVTIFIISSWWLVNKQEWDHI